MLLKDILLLLERPPHIETQSAQIFLVRNVKGKYPLKDLGLQKGETFSAAFSWFR
jgi:hypothetical protein